MNTYIAIKPDQTTQLFATNNLSNDFEQRFWRSVAQLQDKQRWLCLVSPVKLPNKQQLAEFGVNINRLLVVHNQTNMQAVNSAYKALKHGKCSAVISWITDLNQAHKSLLSAAAKQGQATSILIKQQKQTVQQRKVA